MARAIRFGASGGPRYRGRKRVVQARLTRREILLALWFFLIALVVLACAMYVGWWTLEKEEQEWNHHDPGQDTSTKILIMQFAGTNLRIRSCKSLRM